MSNRTVSAAMQLKLPGLTPLVHTCIYTYASIDPKTDFTFYARECALTGLTEAAS